MSIVVEQREAKVAKSVSFVGAFAVSLIGVMVLVAWTFWLIEDRQSAALLAFAACFLTVAGFLLGNTYSLKEYRTQLGKQIRFGNIAPENVALMPTRSFLLGRLRVLKGAVWLGAVAVFGAVLIVNSADGDAWVVGMVALLLAVLSGGIATISQPMGTVELTSLRNQVVTHYE